MQFAPRLLALCVGLMLGHPPAHSQQSAGLRPEAPAFRLYRWQEDYSYLALRERTGGWETLRYLPVAGLRDSYLSLGGEVRNRIDAYDPYLFGIGRSGFAWASEQARVFQHFDLHLGQGLRAFAQLDTSFESGRPVQRAFDQSLPDLRLAFGDVVVPFGQGTAMVRAGRQDLYLGSSRWQSATQQISAGRSTASWANTAMRS